MKHKPTCNERTCIRYAQDNKIPLFMYAPATMRDGSPRVAAECGETYKSYVRRVYGLVP